MIILYKEKDDSFHAFIKRFSEWFGKIAFTHSGDIYFQNHPLNELWEIWKEDVRFLYVYCDEHYEKWMESYLDDLFREFAEFDYLEITLEDLLLYVSSFVSTRLELVMEHFLNNEHVEYIEKHVQFKNQTRLNGMKLSQQT